MARRAAHPRARVGSGAGPGLSRRLWLVGALFAALLPLAFALDAESETKSPGGAPASPLPAGGAVAAPPAGTAPVKVVATPSQTEPSVGEIFTVELKAVGPPGTEFTFPAETSTETFELRPAPPPVGSPPPEPGVRRYQAELFALGEVEIPPLPVYYRLPDGTGGETATQALRLKVRSLLPKAADERKLVDIRGPVGVAIGRAFWLALAATAVLAAALGVWLVRRRRRAEAPAIRPVPELPPAAEALRALDALAASRLLADGEYRAYYIRLMVVAKRYLERRLSAPVLEMTSAETLGFLRGHSHGGEAVSAMRDLAEAADRIKFARGDGLRDEAARHLEAVRTLVSGLERRLEPPPAVGEAA